MLVNIRDLKNKAKPPVVQHVSPINNDELNELLVMATKKANQPIIVGTGGTGVIPVPSPIIAQYVNMPAIQVGTFGGDAITSVAGYGSQVTNQLKMSDMPDFQDKVVNILLVAKSVRLPKDAEKQSRWDKFVNKTKYTREKLISDFSTVKEQIDNMLTVVDQRQQVLSTANETLDELYTNNVAEYEKLTNYIEIGLGVIEYKKQELATLQANITDDLLEAQKASDLSALIQRWEMRVDNLRKFQMSAIQTAPTIRALQTNNLKLVDKFSDLKHITIPSWEKQFALRINMQDQQKANKVANAIDDATNEFMLESSKLLGETSVAIAKSNQRGSIYIETLEGVQHNLVNMFAEIKDINEAGDIARADAYNRMEDMKQVYLQLAKDGLS